MKKLFAAAMVVATAGLWACGAGGDVDNTPDAGNEPDAGQPQGGETIEVTADITADTTWTTGNTYVLKKHVVVKSGTLTVEKGVTVKGGEGTSLLITREGKINAVGTREQPIVFTSAQPEGERKPGNWGGVVLLGKAPINVTGGTNAIEGYNPADFGDLITYGGNDATHSCGTIKYARIEFAGYELAKDMELNGLTLGGCGSNTELDYIQIHKGADDGIELFGGTVNVKHLLVTQPDDDGVDWDLGWSGKAQFVIVQQNALVGDKGFECDTQKANPKATPLSQPEIWNATLIGSDQAPGTAGKTQWAMHLKNGTAGKMSNFVVAYFTDGMFDVDGAAAAENFDAGKLFVKDSIFWKNGGLTDMFPVETKDNDNGFDEAAKFMDASQKNTFADPKLEAAKSLTAPNFKPVELLTGGATPPADGFFDATATFKGAVGAEDWTAGWTAYPSK